MLSSVLNSRRAVQMNILIIRAFVKLRQLLATHKALAEKLETMERTQKLILRRPGSHHPVQGKQRARFPESRRCGSGVLIASSAGLRFSPLTDPPRSP
jgi:IS5 family transposase